MILNKGVDTNLPSTPDGTTPLQLSIEQGNVALAQRLLDAGADINLRNAAGDTALLLAVKQTPVNYQLVQLLLSRRPSPTTSAPDLTATDAQGRTAEVIAIERNDQRLVSLFQAAMAPAGEPVPEVPATGAGMP